MIFSTYQDDRNNILRGLMQLNDRTGPNITVIYVNIHIYDETKAFGLESGESDRRRRNSLCRKKKEAAFRDLELD